jgi:hypothetical protein
VFDSGSPVRIMEDVSLGIVNHTRRRKEKTLYDGKTHCRTDGTFSTPISRRGAKDRNREYLGHPDRSVLHGSSDDIIVPTAGSSEGII